MFVYYAQQKQRKEKNIGSFGVVAQKTLSRLSLYLYCLMSAVLLVPYLLEAIIKVNLSFAFKSKVNFSV